MSTSLLYHAFGLVGYDYRSQTVSNGEVTFTVAPKAKSIRCPECNSLNVVKRGSSYRKLRAAPIGLKKVWIRVNIPRIFCLECFCIRRIKINFAEKRRTYTRSFAKYVLTLTRVMSLKDVASILGVGWDLVKGIYKKYLKKRFSKPKLKKLEYIAIDEISIKKGHRYVTLVMDLKSGAVVFVGDGKGADALKPFWKRLKSSRAKIKAVATDMGPAYISAVIENLPSTPLVFDRFHVVKLMNEKLSKIRRSLQKELKETMDKDVIKGTRWLLLKNPSNLSEDRNEKERLEEALRLNEPLAVAYYMKEDLRQIWNQANKDEAAEFLDDWIERAKASGIKQLGTMGKTMAAHRKGILAWYEHPISSGPMEGTNNKIKTMKRQAYGYRDMEFFKLRILGIHESKYSQTG